MIYSCCRSRAFPNSRRWLGRHPWQREHFCLIQTKGSRIALFNPCRLSLRPASQPASRDPQVHVCPAAWALEASSRGAGPGGGGGCPATGPLEPRPGSLSERRLHNAGQALCFAVVVSRKPQGPIQENAHVPSLYPLLLPKGISFPLLFSTVGCSESGAQDPAWVEWFPTP